MLYSVSAMVRNEPASYRQEIHAATLVSRVPATAIPARDRALIARMRTGKRITRSELHQLDHSLRKILLKAAF